MGNKQNVVDAPARPGIVEKTVNTLEQIGNAILLLASRGNAAALAIAMAALGLLHQSAYASGPTLPTTVDVGGYITALMSSVATPIGIIVGAFFAFLLLGLLLKKSKTVKSS